MVEPFVAIGVPEHPVSVEIVFPVYVKSTPANLAVPALRNSDVSVRYIVLSPLVVAADNVDVYGSPKYTSTIFDPPEDGMQILFGYADPIGFVIAESV